MLSYDRDKAAKYALENVDAWDNTQFPEYDTDNSKNTSDCANFVSQCLYAGGAMMKRSEDRYSDWWCHNLHKGRAWAGAQSLRLALKKNNIAGIKAVSQSDPSGLLRGDIIFTPIRADRFKPKNFMRAGHVMMLVEDFTGELIKVCQRGCPKEQRIAYKKPDNANMIFYHIESDDNNTLNSTANIEYRLNDIEQRLTTIENRLKERTI